MLAAAVPSDPGPAKLIILLGTPPAAMFKLPLSGRLPFNGKYPGPIGLGAAMSVLCTNPSLLSI